MHTWYYTFVVSLIAPALSSVVWFFILRYRVSAAYHRGIAQAGEDFATGRVLGYYEGTRDAPGLVRVSILAERLEEIRKRSISE